MVRTVLGLRLVRPPRGAFLAARESFTRQDDKGSMRKTFRDIIRMLMKQLIYNNFNWYFDWFSHGNFNVHLKNINLITLINKFKLFKLLFK